MRGEKIVAQPILPPLSKLPIRFSSREEALMAKGDVRLHFKGGVYRKLGTAISTENGRTLAIYEHLWPHAHQYYVRDDEEFEGMKNAGEDRGETEWIERFKRVGSSPAGSGDESPTLQSSRTSSEATSSSDSS